MTPDELPADMEGRLALRLRVDPDFVSVQVDREDLRDLLKAYQKQRRALEEASPVVPVGWRDITTAPRDGRVVLVFSAARCVWSVVSAQWRQDWPNGGWDTISKHTTPIVPTHWMPLPAAPTDTGREA